MDMRLRLTLTLIIYNSLCIGVFMKGVQHGGEDAYDHYHPHRIPDAIPSKVKANSAAKISTEMDDVDWTTGAEQSLMTSLNNKPKLKAAKNVIMFIGDGMSVSTLTSARFLKAQKSGKSIVDTSLSWEKFPSTGLLKTYNTDFQTPDSAGTATAFQCGEKTRSGVICLNHKAHRANCSLTEGNHLKSSLHHAIDEGKWTGIVTTARITHATPAAAYAHCADRNWESEWFVPVEYRVACWDIARQLVHNEPNQHIRVLLGGGRRYLLPDTAVDSEYPDKYGWREDGLDLIQDWKDIKTTMGLSDTDFAYVDNKRDFNDVNASTIQYLMGLFERTHMKYESERLLENPDGAWSEPSLTEMVIKAIDILSRGPSGYFLYVEGGRIDHAHHDGNAYNALHETLALDEAVQRAVDMTDEEETLIIVTADHSHVFTMGGYPDIGTDIFGNVEEEGSTVWADDSKPYLTLAYANGPGYSDHRTNDDAGNRMDLSWYDTYGTRFRQDAGVPLYSETHGGEDVLVYANGPMSHLLSGQHEQPHIAHVARYAACLSRHEMCPLP